MQTMSTDQRTLFAYMSIMLITIIGFFIEKESKKFRQCIKDGKRWDATIKAVEITFASALIVGIIAFEVVGHINNFAFLGA